MRGKWWLILVLFLAPSGLLLETVGISVAAVQAQTVEARKAEADRLLEQGVQQFRTSQFNAALQSSMQALQIYRDLKDRLGEANSLRSLSNAYLFLEDTAKAIEYYNQSLAIAREIKDRWSEGSSLTN